VGARLPLFPLGTVLFPGLVLPLHVFEPRYRALVSHLVNLPADDPREFGVVAIRRGWEVLNAAPGGGLAASTALTLYEVGCSAEIRQLTEHPDGRFDLVTVGRRRFRVTAVDAAAAPYPVADVEWLSEPEGDPARAERLAAAVMALFQRYLAVISRETPDVGEQLPDRPRLLSYLVAATVALSPDDRQRLLAAPDTVGRLRAEREMLSREVTLLHRVRAVPVPLADLAVRTSPN
jgi:uncharacterized protein